VTTEQAAGVGGRAAGPWLPRWLWPSFAAPATFWLLALFVAPFYVILCVAFGQLDPIFLTPKPVYNPLQWQFDAFGNVVRQLLTPGSVYRAAFVRTFAFVGIATALCLVIGYPVAYFMARHAGRFKTAFLVAFFAPFWISYMMRMLAWISLLQENGYVNRLLTGLHIVPGPVAWLEGRPATVILGLVYGYIPFMILPLFATLDRIDRSMLEAARDLGAPSARTFWRITLPLSRQAILAGCVLVSLPMFGDYFTQSLLAASRNTAMLGNLIVSSVQSSLVAEGASLVLILMALLLIPIMYYLRTARRAGELIEA
jgi:ABC-type spermidine/putrescine transport system permease subunit I